MVAAAVGAVTGDNIGYQLGLRLGRAWLLHHGRRFGISQARLERAEQFFGRQGPKAVFLGRFIGFARALVPFVAGATRMPLHRFVLYDAVGAILWTVGCTLLGYGLGASWQLAERWLGRLGLVLALGIVAAALLARRRARARAGRQNTA